MIKQVREPKKSSEETMVKLGKTSYHYYRKLIKPLRREHLNAHFIKNSKNWKGSIIASKEDVKDVRKLISKQHIALN